MSSDEDFDSTPNIAEQYSGLVRPYMYEPLSNPEKDIELTTESDETHSNFDSDPGSTSVEYSPEATGSPESEKSSPPSTVGLLEWLVSWTNCFLRI